MANPDSEMPRHVEAVHKDAVENIIFLKRQQWVATNYALLVYAASFVISALLSSDRFCTKFPRHSCDRHVFCPLLHNVLIPTRDG
jgi:hypothetical protein